MNKYLVTPEEIEKYTLKNYGDCVICGKETLITSHDGTALCLKHLTEINKGLTFIPPKPEDTTEERLDRFDPEMREKLEQIEKKNSKADPTIPEIKMAVEAHFGIKEGSIDDYTRKREIVMARQVAMVISKLRTNESLASIGSQIGNKDHATVLHAIKTIKNLYDTDRVIRLDLKPLLEDLKCLDEFLKL